MSFKISFNISNIESKGINKLLISSLESIEKGNQSWFKDFSVKNSIYIDSKDWRYADAKSLKLNGDVVVSHGEETKKADYNEFSPPEVNYKDELSFVVENEVLQYGEITGVDRLFEKWRVNLGAEKFLRVLQDLLRLYAGSPKALVFIYKAMSNLPFHELGSPAVMAGTFGMVNADIEVRDAALRMFEMWESKDNIEVLRNIRVHPKWLDEYRESIVEYLEGL